MKDTTHVYSDGELTYIYVKEKDENGRELKYLQYEADEVTINHGNTHTYKDTEYGYMDTKKILSYGGIETETLIYMYDKDGNKLGDIVRLPDGGREERWDKGERWYYSAENKLQKKEILWPNTSIIKALYEYDAGGKEIIKAYEYDETGYVIKAAYEYENGKQIKLVQNTAGEWVRPSDGSGTGESGSSVSGSDSSDVTGNNAAGN